MKVCAVICELNPFTLGHEYLFRTARSLTGADYIIALMSGDFVQRGLPAVCDKYTRCEAALKGGADLVMELPTIYATASADYFAYGSVTLLDSLGCVDFLCFGSESGDLKLLKGCMGKSSEAEQGIHILSQGIRAEEAVTNKISQLLKEGVSYAKAYAEVTGNVYASNDMLAMRYIKSLDMRYSHIAPVAVIRKGAGYTDESLSSNSAAAIRKRIFNGEDYAHLMPGYAYKLLKEKEGLTFPLSADDFSRQLYGIIDFLCENEGRLDCRLLDYMDVSKNIEGRIKSLVGDFTGFCDFAARVHSKEYTKSRIYRALTHILLGIRKEHYPEDISECEAYYGRILGFKKGSEELLGCIKERSVIPIISKAADAGKILDDEAMGIFDIDVHAGEMYDKMCVFKYAKSPVAEYANRLVIV